jgi:signal transduction histidine kinase
MSGEPQLTRGALRTAAWALAPALIAGTLVLEDRIAATGYDYSDATLSAGTLAVVLAFAACWLVGVVLTWRVPTNIVGWLFLALATAMAASGIADAYGTYALRASSHDLALGELSAVVGDGSFAWWFLLLGLILQLTPTGRPLSDRWQWLVWLTVASAGLFQIGVLLRSTPLEAPNDGVVSPLAIDGLSGPISAVAAVAVLTLGLCLVASVGAVFVRFGRSRGEERQQMLWLVAGVAPTPVCVVFAFATSYADHDELALWALLVSVASLVVGAAFSIVNYRLYGVENVAGAALSYAVATVAVVGTYALAVVVATETIPGVTAGATSTTIIATLLAAGVALPVYRWARDGVDRRFNRRRFDALHVVRSGLQTRTTDVEALLRAAVGDPGLRVLFAGGDGGWVASDGRAVQPGRHVVDVERRGAVGARVEFDPALADGEIVRVVTREAAAEIDNLALRAELARQLQQTQESRARLAGAHLEERRRMERDLHDGAQQRLLAIAFQLQSARVNGSADLLRDEAANAIGQLGLAVQELRDLANGLQPPSLAGGGLLAVVEDLAARSPLLLHVDVADRRFETGVETAAWFVVAESVANAVKYSCASEVHIAARADDGWLTVSVRDEGVGGADPRGHGLQGLSDRVAALGGRLTVTSEPAGGTVVEATLPCGS